MRRTAARVSGEGNEEEEPRQQPQERQEGEEKENASKRGTSESGEACEFFRVAPPRVLRRFVDAPANAESFEELQQHASPRDLVLQAAWLVANEQPAENATAKRRPEEIGAGQRRAEGSTGDVAESEDLQLITQALRKCITYDGVLEALLRDVDLRPVLLGASESTSTLMRRLLSQQILALVRRNKQGLLLAIEGELPSVLPDLLGDSDVGVASDASAALLKMLDYPAGEDIFFSSSMFSQIDRLADSDAEILKIRTLSLFVEAGAKSPRVFKKLEERNAFRKLLDAFFTEDLLLKINAISLIERLGSYPAGVNFLRGGDVPSKLLRELGEDCLDETSSVALVHLLASLLEGHPEMVKDLFEAHDGLLPRTLGAYMHACAAVPQEKAELCCALGAWGSIAGSAVGYATLQQAVPGIAEKVVEHFFDETEVANLAVDAWTHALTGLSRSGASASVENILKDVVIPQTLKLHMERPFGESRRHSYPLLKALSCSKEAVHLFFASTPFRLLLVDPFSEDSSEAKYAKNDFLKALLKVHRGWLGGVVDESYLSRLEELANGGPFYVPPGARPADPSQSTAS